MTDEQLRLEALKQAVHFCARRGMDSTELMWYTEQFLKFLKGEVNE